MQGNNLSRADRVMSWSGAPPHSNQGHSSSETTVLPVLQTQTHVCTHACMALHAHTDTPRYILYNRRCCKSLYLQREQGHSRLDRHSTPREAANTQAFTINYTTYSLFKYSHISLFVPAFSLCSSSLLAHPEM